MMKEPELAVMISSYARPSDLLRQIFSMGMNQTWKKAHLFVAVKGVPESVVEGLIRPQVARLEEEGRLTLKVSGNTNQAWNLMDTIRGEDIERYSLFLKVDDDDFYHPEYLRICAESIMVAPKDSSTCVGGNYKALYPSEWSYRLGTLFKPGYVFFGWGDMLGMSLKVVKHLLRVYEDDDLFWADMKRLGQKEGYDLGCQEDRYYLATMKRMGPCVDITPLFDLYGISPVVVGEHNEGNSIMRGLWKNKVAFFNAIRFARNPRTDREREWVIEDDEENVFSLFLGRMTNLKTKEEERYVSFTPGKVELENGEEYNRREDGKYVKTGRDSGD